MVPVWYVVATYVLADIQNFPPTISGYQLNYGPLWNFTKQRKDLWGWCDILAIRKDEVLAVQVTASAVADRIKKIQEGVFGINIHKAGADSTYVENWSEGCQVFKRAKDFDEFMAICRKAKDIHGNSFTYTLIETKDIV